MSTDSKPLVLITSHVVFTKGNPIFGPCHAISGHLKNKQIDHVLIQHPLYYDNPTVIEKTLDGVHSSEASPIPRVRRLSFLQFPIDVLITFLTLQTLPRITLLVAIDPLNAITGILLKWFGKVDTLIFYTADYAPNRFSNLMLNGVYHLVDRISCRFADYVWNVSSRITHIRSKQGLTDKKNRFVPNAPLVANMLKHRKKTRIPHSMVLIANFTPAIDYEAIILAAKKLLSTYPDIHISFIGSGVKEEAIKQMAIDEGLEKNVIFHGFQNHEDAMDIIASHEIGLAVYDNKWSWTPYGDSLKAREYLGLGLPVIISDHISTASDIATAQAGFAIPVTPDTLAKALDSVFADKQKLDTMTNNALKLAEDFDLTAIFDRELLVHLTKS